MIRSLPVMKNHPVSASAAEATTNFKMLKFTCVGPFRRSCAHIEDTTPKKKYPAELQCASGSVRYDSLV